jgi:hypothetical protein
VTGTNRKRTRLTEKTSHGGDKLSRNNCSAKALLDTGCLIGDCMPQNIVYKLKAMHLIVHTNTTICSGFNNECSKNFPTLLIKISYFNERTLSLEGFETTVYILPKTPIDLIIGRKTIKQ